MFSPTEMSTESEGSEQCLMNKDFCSAACNIPHDMLAQREPTVSFVHLYLISYCVQVSDRDDETETVCPLYVKKIGIRDLIVLFPCYRGAGG